MFDERRHPRQTDGKYVIVNPCRACGRGAGDNYAAHPETDRSINDELICLCRQCAKRLCRFPGPDAVDAAKKRLETGRW